MGLHFRSMHYRVFNLERLNQLSGLQYRIWNYSMHCSHSLDSIAMGIYDMNTSQFACLAPEQLIQNELGRTEEKVSMALYNKIVPLSPEEKKMTIGNLVTNFPDILEYDPYAHVIYSKLLFEYSCSIYLTTGKAIIDGIHKDFKKFRDRVPERWFAEFMNTHKSKIKNAWKEFCISHEKKPYNNFESVKKSFDKLFELERDFSPSNIPAKIISAERMKEFEKFIHNFNR